MKKIVWVICGLGLLCFCLSFLSSCSLMYGKADFLSDNLIYQPHSLFYNCFVSCYTWPSDGNYAELTIPDTCEGYRTTALGGYAGIGVPCPFMVKIPDVQYSCPGGSLPEDAEIEQYHLVINIGKYMREDKYIVMDDYHNVGENQFVQVLVTINCSPDNPYFYSKDGKLYRKSDDSLVEGFFYYSDYYEKPDPLTEMEGC